MANSVSSNIGNYVRDVGNSRGAIAGNKVRGPSGKETNEKKATGISNLFGDSAKVEFSPEVEMFGKVVDLLQKKYDNADVFVAGPGDDLSQIGGDLEYSIILSEDEMKLLSSDAPQDKEAKDKLLGQIDDAMSKISDLGKKIGENTNEKDEVSNFGISLDKNGKLNFFADINGKSYADTSMDALVKNLVSDKTAQN